MKNAEIVRRRLHTQHLTTQRLTSPAEVVRSLGAVQAQDYAGAKWAVAQRTVSATDADLERAMTDGAIIRTHVLRPTWHFVAPEDLRWMLALTGPYVKRRMAPYDPKIGLDDATYRKSNAALATALRDGAFLTRTELADALRTARIDPSGTQRLAHLVMRAELDGIVCSGPRRGKQFTYALVDTRVPTTPTIDRDEALGRLALRYFPTRGPATVHDFVWWSGLNVSDARRAIDIAGDALAPVEIDGIAHWLGANAETPPPARQAHLLPNYDEYFVGFRERGAALERVRTLAPDARTEALFAHVVAVGGQLVGGWTRANDKSPAVVTLSLAVPVTAAERQRLRATIARYSAFLGVDVDVRDT